MFKVKIHAIVITKDQKTFLTAGVTKCWNKLHAKLCNLHSSNNILKLDHQLLKCCLFS